MRWPTTATLEYGHDGLGFFLPSKGGWCFPRLKNQGVNFKLGQRQTLTRPIFDINTHEVYRGQRSAKISGARQQWINDITPQDYVPFNVLNEVYLESFNVQSGFEYDPYFGDLISFDKKCQPTRAVSSQADGTVKLNEVLWNNGADLPELQQISHLNVGGIVYQCEMLAKDRIMVRTAKGTAVYEIIESNNLHDYNYDGNKERQLRSIYEVPSDLVEAGTSDLYPVVHSDARACPSTSKLGIVDNRGWVVVFDEGGQESFRSGAPVESTGFLTGVLNYDSSSHQDVLGRVLSRWRGLSWENENQLLVSDRRGFSRLDVRDDNSGGKQHQPLIDFRHEILCHAIVDEYDRNNLFCATSTMLKWHDIRYMASPVLEWRHGLSPQDTSLKLALAQTTKSSSANEPITIALLHSELLQAGSLVYEFGRTVHDLPASMQDPLMVENLELNDGIRSMKLFSGENGRDLIQFAVTTQGKIWSQFWRADAEKRQPNEEQELDESCVRMKHEEPFLGRNKHECKKLSGGSKKISFYEKWRQLITGNEYDFKAEELQKFGLELSKKVNDFFENVDGSQTTLGALVDSSTVLDPEHFPAMLQQLAQNYDDSKIHVEAMDLDGEVRFHDIYNFLHYLWEIDESSEDDEWYKLNHELLIAQIANQIMLGMMNVYVDRGEPNLRLPEDVSSKVKDLLDEWTIGDTEEQQDELENEDMLILTNTDNLGLTQPESFLDNTQTDTYQNGPVMTMPFFSMIEEDDDEEYSSQRLESQGRRAMFSNRGERPKKKKKKREGFV